MGVGTIPRRSWAPYNLRVWANGTDRTTTTTTKITTDIGRRKRNFIVTETNESDLI
jgi:hypothetical protein